MSQIFLDSDGVLADFDRAFKNEFGITPDEFREQHGQRRFWGAIRGEAHKFFETMPLMEDAMVLYDAVKHLRPIILTGCPWGGWAELQKIKAGRIHFPGVPLIVCSSKDKSVYCQPGDILVDDRTKYVPQWKDAGGIYVIHTSALNSIEQLKELGVI